VTPPLLTVIIPTYNRPRQLLVAVSSVRTQTLLPHEIIIVDDGSTLPVDQRSFNLGSVPIRVIRKYDAQGVAAARNRGVAAATGDFIAFLDDDDTWVPWKLEVVVDFLSKNPDVDVLIHQTGYQPSERGDIDPWVQIGSPLKRMLHRQPPHLDGVVVRRVFHVQSPMDANFGGAEDLDYLIRLAKSDARMVETGATLAVRRDSNQTHIRLDTRIRGRLELLSRHPEILDDRKAASFFYVRLGHLQRRANLRQPAFRSFLTAGRYNPFSPLVWKGFVHCLRPLKIHAIRDSRTDSDE